MPPVSCETRLLPMAHGSSNKYQKTMRTKELERLLSEQGDICGREACGLYVNGCLMSNYERYVVLIEDADGRTHREDVFNLGALNELLRDFHEAVSFIIKWGPGWYLEIREDLREAYDAYLEYLESIDIPDPEYL